MKFPLYLLFSVFILNCSTPPSEEKLLIENLLPSGKISYEELVLNQSPRLTELMSKFQSGVSTNFDWFIRYASDSLTQKNNKSLHDQKLGLSPAEIKEIKELLDDLRLKVKSKSSVDIINEQGFISFYHHDPYNLLNYVQFNTIQNIVNVDTVQLGFYNESDITDSSNIYGSGWKGYTWKYEVIDSISIDSLRIDNINNYEMISYKVVIGKLNKSKNVFINIEMKEISKGSNYNGGARFLFKKD